MTKLNIFLIEDCKSEAEQIIDKLHQEAEKRTKPEYSFCFKHLEGTRQTDYEGEKRAFYEPDVIERIEELHLQTVEKGEKMGILLDVLLTQEDIENTLSSYYPQADLAKQIYSKFHDSIPVYMITGTATFATQSDVIMGVDLSDQFIAKNALLRYELVQDIDKLFNFYERNA
ncbi:MAG: hypothetical protein PUJ55_16255 [Clostridiales bacterium]|nr:hypothetical protein [Roseburia sp.]MDD7638474.1 hypothetical protein [Clostridiales bacterium]MDY4113222.1 hypothetical protein [Roseburia sp.]